MRDDFTKPTIERLAKRAGYLCSNPTCRRLTVRPAQGDDGDVSIGVAAHITAAAPGGPRYDSALTSDQRRQASNGIWLCQSHGKHVDSDPNHYTVEILREWKQRAESDVLHALVTGGAMYVAAEVLADGSERGRLDDVLRLVAAAALVDIATFKAMPSRPPHVVALGLRTASGSGTRRFDASTLAKAIGAFNEVIIVAPPGTGKTTTQLQIVEAILERGDLVAVFVPLGEWSSQDGPVLDRALALLRITLLQFLRTQFGAGVAAKRLTERWMLVTMGESTLKPADVPPVPAPVEEPEIAPARPASSEAPSPTGESA